MPSATNYQKQTVGAVDKATMAQSATDSIGSRELGFAARGRANTVNGGDFATGTTTISATTMALLMGVPQTLTAFGTNAAGDRLVGDTVTWATDDDTVATVSSAGVVTAVAAGTCNITATIESTDSTACAVTVTAVLTALILTPDTLSFAHTTTGTTTASATDQFGNSMTLPGGSVCHSSDATKATAAIVSTTVTVTGVAAGSTNVTITNSGVTSNTCAVTCS